MKQIIITLTFISLSFGGDNLPSFFNGRLTQLPQELQKHISQNDLNWKHLPNKQLSRSFVDPSEIPGAWDFVDSESEMLITVGTDQALPNPMQMIGMEEALGGIEVTGGGDSLQTTLTYILDPKLFGEGEESDTTLLGIISNFSIMLGENPDSVEYPMILAIGSTTEDLQPNLVEAYLFSQEGGILSADSAHIVSAIQMDSTHSIHIDSLYLTDLLTGDSLLFVGTIGPEIIQFTAGEPTELPFFVDDFGPAPEEDETYAMEFYEAGYGYEIYTWFDYDNFEEWSDTTEFEWLATDDSLLLIFHYYDYEWDEEYIDSVSLSYTIANDVMSLSMEFDICEMAVKDGDYDNVESCYEDFGYEFGLMDIESIVVNFWMDLSYAGPVAAITEETELNPGTFVLQKAYPNPFNPITTLQYEMGSGGHLSVQVYDVSGRMVRSLYNGIQSPGQHEIRWDARDNGGRSVSSGIYLFKANSNGTIKTIKTLLLK